ncbi:MAG: cyclase family protein, partial [Candidatus Hydrogenedentes bacterium]|nr:cyclase family protein [Candidatus Hydrogenedentota bacterium]
PSSTLPPRVLFKTRNSQRPVTAPFAEDYVAVDAAAAQRMVEDGVLLVGIDALSIAPFDQPGDTTHHILLRNEVLIVEGLRLVGLTGGTYPFVVLPLSIPDADGAPARAFIGLQFG